MKFGIILFSIISRIVSAIVRPGTMASCFYRNPLWITCAQRVHDNNGSSWNSSRSENASRFPRNFQQRENRRGKTMFLPLPVTESRCKKVWHEIIDTSHRRISWRSIRGFQVCPGFRLRDLKLRGPWKTWENDKARECLSSLVNMVGSGLVNEVSSWHLWLLEFSEMVA